MKNILIIAGIVLSCMYMPLREAESSSGSKVRVLRSDGEGVVVELKLDGFQTETIEHEGLAYQKIMVPDTVQSDRPGKPQVPVSGALIGVPSIEGASLQIIDAGFDTVQGYRLYPAPLWRIMGDNLDNLLERGRGQTFAPDQDVYYTNAFYPGMIADIGYTGYMRNQAVAQIQFYPVQYNPVANEIRFYRYIIAKFTWNTPVSAKAKARGASDVYERILMNNILNYGALARPSAAENASLPEVTETRNDAIDSDGSHLKIGIREDGMYKLTYNDLADAGLKLGSIDPRAITMSNRGSEIPIFVSGEDDGKFDTSDYVLFYGSANNDIYTSKNVYWLTADGGNGKRMGTVDGTLSGKATIPKDFPATLHTEKSSYYWQTIPNGAGEDHWFWDDKLTAPSSKDYLLSLNHISTANGTATVRARLKGRTEVQDKNPDHHTKIYLNDIEVDDQSWDGQHIYDHETTVPHAYLNEGTNTVRIEAVGDTGATVDQVFVNWIEVDYLDTYVAENDELLFAAPADGTFQFEVAGFRSNDVGVFDVTDASSVALVANANVLAKGNTYTVQLEDDAQTGTRFLALTPSRYKSPASIESDQSSSWKSAGNKADYIIITHEDFYTSAQKLAKYRSDAGLRVVTVKIEDIYDEFNYGIFNPQAIRDFLTYAYNNWITPAPAYVLLIGDACQDFKDNLKTGTVNYVPSQNIETDILGETPSDNWFVLVSGEDILPDMFIGRLSVQTKTGAEDVINKIISYEQNPPKASWNRNALLVADDEDASFEDMSEQLAGLLPDDYKVNKVYVNKYSSGGDPTKDIIDYMDKGSILTNYAGHGSVDMWGLWDGSKHIFDSSDIRSLNNTNKLTTVTIGDCLNGFFTGTNPQICVAEEFQRLKEKGAVAVWAPTALSYTSGHKILMSELYEAIFQKRQYGLGAATTDAKVATYAQSSYWGELVETFVLFGDPATQLGVPKDAETSLSVLSPNGGEVITSWSTFSVQWEAPQDIVKFTLKYSLNNGNSWKKIAKNVQGASYEWDTPSLKKDKNQCLIQVTGFDVSGKKRGNDASDSIFTIKAVQ